MALHDLGNFLFLGLVPELTRDADNTTEEEQRGPGNVGSGTRLSTPHSLKQITYKLLLCAQRWLIRSAQVYANVKEHHRQILFHSDCCQLSQLYVFEQNVENFSYS